MAVRLSGVELILASGNAHKAREVAALLGDAKVLTLKDAGFEGAIVEDGLTFEENARIKVEGLCEFVRKSERWRRDASLVLLADDSGLEVDALGGAPGVWSARFAGEPSNDAANISKLLDLLKGVSGARRTARFRCVLAAKRAGGHTRVFTGACEGKIGFQPKGASGFGYDPLFFPVEFCRTFAELGAEEKNQVSHRAMAMAKFRKWLEELRIEN